MVSQSSWYSWLLLCMNELLSCLDLNCQGYLMWMSWGLGVRFGWLPILPRSLSLDMLSRYISQLLGCSFPLCCCSCRPFAAFAVSNGCFPYPGTGVHLFCIDHFCFSQCCRLEKHKQIMFVSKIGIL